MKRLLHLSVILTSIILFATACEEEMPEPNEWRILEWTVDGERHKATCESEGLFGCTATDVNYNLNNGNLELMGGTKINGFTEIVYIYIFRGLSLKERIPFGINDHIEYTKLGEDESCRLYRADNSNHRFLYISRIDSTSRIIEGYYEFEGVNDCQDTIQIKDGYFKVSF